MESNPGNGLPYGAPLRCPACPPETAFRMLKLPGIPSKPCPDCGTRLVNLRKKRRRPDAV